jgi:hypothetical protein
MKTTLIYTYHDELGPQQDMLILDLNLHQLRRELVTDPETGQQKMVLPLQDLIEVEHIIKEETQRKKVMVKSIRRTYEPSEKEVELKVGHKVFIDELTNEIVPNYGEILKITGETCNIRNPYGQEYHQIPLNKCKILG